MCDWVPAHRWESRGIMGPKDFRTEPSTAEKYAERGMTPTASRVLGEYLQDQRGPTF